ncbi:hypothetical protein F5Y11DRAFT_181488 [Daldinia sp. FL1419]|nr:hypothetical protein F5Y11DRAFT_181488 [Daldinia sp. FL1419]
MKATYAIFLLAAQMASVLSSPSPAVLNAECDASGAIDIAQLPEGIDAGAVRKCVEHPLGSASEESIAKREGALFERDCWYGKSHGCSKGYCWKTCGDGPWCWTARNGGFGDWYTCKSDNDCQTSYSCGESAGGKECKKCGCSC